MTQLIVFNIILLLISLLLMTMNLFMSKKSLNNREKMSPFECGFDPISLNHLPFSIHFFMISLIFLIFDIEIAILIPLIYSFMKFSPWLMITSILFLLILIYGLYIEYLEQSIDWKI